MPPLNRVRQVLQKGFTKQGLVRVFGPYALAVAIVVPLWLWPRPLPFSARVTTSRVVFALPAQDRPLVDPNEDAAAEIRIEPFETLTLSSSSVAKSGGRTFEIPAGTQLSGKETGSRITTRGTKLRAASYPCRPSTLIAEKIDQLGGFRLAFVAEPVERLECRAPATANSFTFDMYAQAGTAILCESCRIESAGPDLGSYEIVPGAAGAIVVKAEHSPVRLEIVAVSAFSLGHLSFEDARFITGRATDAQSSLMKATLKVPYIGDEEITLGERQLLEVDSALEGVVTELTQFAFENDMLVVAMRGEADEIRAGGQVYRLNMLQQLRAQSGLGYLFDSLIYVATFVTSLRSLLGEARQKKKKT